MDGRLSSPSHSNSKAGQGAQPAAGTPQAHKRQPAASARNRPPSGRLNQKYKQRDWKRQQQQQHWTPEARTRPNHPDQPGYELTGRGRQQLLFDQLEQQYGPNFAETDVRLYLKKRQLNAARGKPTRRGGFPVDDSFDKPGTILKLSEQFQRTILQERSIALSADVGRLPVEAAWKLYSHVPRLLTFMTLEVAHKIRAMSRATGLYPTQVVNQLCSFSPLAFVHPGSLESRLGLCAKLTRMDRQQAVQLMNQHPQLWMMNSRLVAPRCEELSLMLSCCSTTALKLLASHPPLLTAQFNAMQQQLDKLSHVMGCGRATAELVPLLLSQPSLLLPPGPIASDNASSRGDDTSSAVQALEPQQQLDLAALETSVVPNHPEHVQKQLQGLAEQLQLPIELTQSMALRAPGVLALPQNSTRSGSMVQQHYGGNGTADLSGSHNTGQAVVTAAGVLSSSWLCSAAATAERQQYQQDTMRLLTPVVTRQKQHTAKQQQANTDKHEQQQLLLKPQQQQQQHWPVGVTRYMAADADTYSAASCQWWTCHSSWHHLQQFTAIQQLAIQAPGLLLQASSSPPPAASPPPSTDMPAAAAAARASYSPDTAAPAPELNTRLDELCLQLCKLLQVNHHLQQQRSAAAWLQRQKQQAETSGSEQVPAVAAEYKQLRKQASSMAILEPNLLAQPVGFTIGRVSEVSRVLLMSPQQLWPVIQHCPAVLWLPGPQLFERIRILCGVLRLSPHEVRQRLLTRAAFPLLLLDGDAVKDSIDAVLRVGAKCGLTEEVARQAVQDKPELLLPGNIRTVADVLSSRL